MPRITVTYPQNLQTAHAVQYTDKKTKQPFYFVHVVVQKDRSVKGLVASLLDHDAGTPLEAYPGLILFGGDEWVFGFPGLRIDTVDRKYHLLVGEIGNTSAAGNERQTIEFALGAPLATHRKKGRKKSDKLLNGGIPIQSPLSQNRYAPSFYAYGSLLNNSPTTGATMTDTNGNTVYNGVPPLQQAYGVWMYQFTGLNAEMVGGGNNGYSFSVTDVAGDPGGPNTQISIT